MFVMYNDRCFIPDIRFFQKDLHSMPRAKTKKELCDFLGVVDSDERLMLTLQKGSLIF